MKNQKGVSLITLIITIIVVIILAVIILRSGASDAPDQAAFSGFTKEMGELQDAVSVAMLTAKGNESIRGNQRSEEQLYNFVARGGYAAISGDASGDEVWLVQADAETIPCTLINKKHAEDSIGMELPERKVETAFGTNQEVSYFVTPKGTVFCWPPYVYDGKSYVTADYALDYADIKATETASISLDFENDGVVDVKVVNTQDGTDTDDQTYARDYGTGKPAATHAGVGVWYNVDGRNDPEYNTEKEYRGVAAGYEFSTYKNNEAAPEVE